MKFLNFLKKKSKESHVKNEKIGRENLACWIDDKFSKIKNKRMIFVGSINARISLLIKDLNQDIENLENINFEKIKAEENIKLIVRENLGNYISHLKKLVYDLEDIEDVEGLKINSVFEAFNKKSRMCYQKATLLIGKEIGNVQINVRTFFKDLDKTHKENGKLIGEIKVIEKLKEKMRYIENNEMIINELRREKEKIEDEKTELGRKLNLTKDEFEKTERNEIYISWKNNVNEFEKEKNKFDVEMRILNGIINFKKLARTWHKNEEEMEIINQYKYNFKESFRKDKSRVLKKLVQTLEGKEKINKKMNEIFIIEEKIDNFKIRENPLNILKMKIKDIMQDIKSLNEKKIREEKKSQKLVDENLKIFEKISGNLEIFSVELVE